MHQTEPGILFVDDDIEVTDGFHHIFSKEFSTYLVNCPKDALKVIDGSNIGVIVCDYFMPEMNGIELLSEILKKYPLVRRILISAKMDLNIALEAIDISKVHKVLVKPFEVNQIRNEIRTQIRIYKSKMQSNLQVDGIHQKIRKPFDLFELQNQELVLIFEPMWKDKKITDYATLIINGVDKIINYLKMLLDLYYKDPNKHIKALEYIKLNLQDLDVISNQYKQLNLHMFSLIMQVYCALMEEEFKEARGYYYEYLNLSHSFHSKFNMQIQDHNKSLLFFMEEKDEDEFLLDGKMTHNIRYNIKMLLELDIKSQIKLNDNYLGYYQKTRTIFYSLIILKNESIVFLKNKLSNFDSQQLYISVDLMQTLSSQFTNKSEMTQTVQFKGGIILIQHYDTLKYIFVISENTLETRLKMRKFMLSTIDLVKSIPILTILNDADSKVINKLAKELFAF